MSLIAAAGLSGLAGLVGAKMQVDASRRAAANNESLQREFAQHGIRWRVEDAKAAGLHPLAALGAQPFNPTPAHVGDSMGPALASMGQDISRAVASTESPREVELRKLQIMTAQADLDGKIIDNQIRASDLARIQQGGRGGGFSLSDDGNFIPGQTSSHVKISPQTRVQVHGDTPEAEVGWKPGVTWMRTATGMMPVPSKDIAESMEEQIVPQMMWAARNYAVPNLATAGVGPYRHSPPSLEQLPKGATSWVWNPKFQEYQPKYPPNLRRTPWYMRR